MSSDLFRRPASFYLAIPIAVFSLTWLWLDARGSLKSSWHVFYEPAVFQACTGQFGVPKGALGVRVRAGVPLKPVEPTLVPEPNWHKELRQFLLQENKSFDCSALPADLKVLPFGKGVGSFQSWLQRGMLLHLLIVGFIWSLTGVSWSAIFPIAAAYLALSSVLFFAILRVFLKPGAALTFAVMLMIAMPPSAAFLVLRLRDFLKVMPILAGALLVLLLAKTKSSRRTLFYSGCLGVVLGAGVNLRADLLLVGVGFCILAQMGMLLRSREFKASTIVLAAVLMFLPFIVGYLVGNLGYPNAPNFLAHFPHLGMSDQRMWDAHVLVSSLSVAPVYIDQEVYRQAQFFANESGYGDAIPYMTSAYGEFILPTLVRAFSTIPFSFLLRIPGVIYDGFTFPIGGIEEAAAGYFAIDDVAANHGYLAIGYVAATLRLALTSFAIVSLAALWHRNANLGLAVLGLVVMFGGVGSILYEWRHIVFYQSLIFALTVAGVFLVAQKLAGQLFGVSYSRRMNDVVFRPIESEENLMATTVAIAGFCTFFLLLIVSAGWQRNAVEGVLRGLEASSFSSVPYKVTDLERVKTRPSCRGRKTRRLACRKTNKNAFVFSPNIEPADGRLLRVGLDLKVCGRDSIDIVVVRTSLKHEQFGSQHVVRVKKRLGNLKEAVYFTIHRDDYTSFDHLRIDERNKTCLVSMTVENGETSRKFLWQAVIDGQLNTLGGFRW